MKPCRAASRGSLFLRSRLLVFLGSFRGEYRLRLNKIKQAGLLDWRYVDLCRDKA
jgi:hypothetical protein